MEDGFEKMQPTYQDVNKIIDHKVATNIQERSFYVLDRFDIYKKHAKWLEMLPRVKPFYAIKCNNTPEIVSFIASLGIGFDCASKGEIDQVLACSVESSRIIYANPCKTKFFIKHAKNVNVDLMTFDNELELHKIAQLYPAARLVLRIKGDEKSSQCKFNIKFGADLANCYNLLKVAKQLDLNVVGVSFHNGSGCEDAQSYYVSIAACKEVFETAEEIGFKMNMLDIGGGFPGDTDAKISFEEIAASINLALDTFFPLNSGVEVIAEPGRYYVSSAMTLATMVIAKRVQYDETLEQDCYMYYLNDGVYGAFNNSLYEHATQHPQLLMGQMNSKRKLHSTVMWGPTCDSVDCVKRDFMFPELQVGEWITFKNMGAYTCSVASQFNGFERAAIITADQWFG